MLWRGPEAEAFADGDIREGETAPPVLAGGAVGARIEASFVMEATQER